MVGMIEVVKYLQIIFDDGVRKLVFVLLQLAEILASGFQRERERGREVGSLGCTYLDIVLCKLCYLYE